VTVSNSSIESRARVVTRPGLWRRIRSLVGMLLTARGTSAAAAQTMIARTLILGINILTGVFSARLLGPAGKGEQVAIIAWAQMIPFCVTLGVPASLLFHAKSNPRDESRLFSAALLLAAGSGIVAGALGAAALPFWLRHFDHRAVLCSQLLMLSVPYSVIFYVAQSVMDVRSKFALENLMAMLIVFLTVLALLALYVTGEVNSVTVALAYALPGPAIGVFGVFYAIRVARPQFRKLRQSAHTLLHFGLRYYVGDLFTVLVGFADQVLITGFLPAHMLGIYVVTASLCRMLSLVQQSITVVLFPRVVGQPLHSIVEDVQRAARVNVAISILPAALIGLGAEPLIKLVYGPGFAPGTAIVWMLLAESLLGGVARILSQAITSVGRPGMVTILNSVQFAVSVVLALALLPRFQIVGVAAAMVTGTSLRFALTAAFYPLVLHARIPRIIPGRGDLMFIGRKLWSSA
jgi:O-antigen/teichoic acid export membrane protein